MRLILPLLLTAALAASAGCFGGDDEAGEGTEPTPTTPTTTTPEETTPTTPTEDNATMEPTKPAPREVFTDTANFENAPAADPADPNTVTAPTQTKPFTVPAEFTTLTLNVTWNMGTPAGVSGGLAVEITDASGTTVASCTVPQGPVQAAPETCTASGTVPATGGEYNAVYRGSGTFTAQVSVVAS